MQNEEMPSIDHDALEFFRVPLYMVYLFDLHKKIQVASTYETNVEYQIFLQEFCFQLC